MTRHHGWRILMHIPVPWVFVLAYLIGAVFEYFFPSHNRTRPLAGVVGFGVFLMVAGAVLAGWCLKIFRKAHTTTVPGETSAELVTRGPYRFSRNPMYLALTFAYLGEAGILKHIWPLPLLPIVIAYLNWMVIPVEEARLLETFPEDYLRYKARVSRWI
jgi:Putative protein-S-isoprenylcysteine methyltransferase